MDIEDFVFYVALFLALVGVLTFIFQMVEASDHNSCHERGDLANVQVTYRKWNGCFVNDQGLWVPFDTWRYNKEHGYVRPAK